MPAGDSATRREAEEFAESLTNGRLICRTIGHSPRESHVNIVTLEGSRKEYYEQILVCRNRCGVEWRLLIDARSGLQVYRKPDYSKAKGYLAKGIGRIDADGKGALRLERMKRHTFEEME